MWAMGVSIVSGMTHLISLRQIQESCLRDGHINGWPLGLMSLYTTSSTLNIDTAQTLTLTLNNYNM